MSDSINQHYVPRLYLKRFTRNGTRIYVFDKFRRLVKPTSIRSVASEDYFYNLPQEGYENIDPLLIDKVFTELENKYAKVLAEVIESVTQGRRITKNQKESLSIHLGLQILRTREFRDSYIELSKKALKELLEFYLKSQMIDAEVQVSINKDFIPSAHAKMIFNPELLGTLVPFLTDCIWNFGINTTTQPLYTSDNPVVKKSHLGHIVPYDSGWLSPGVEIVFPLSSQLILFLYGRELFRKTESQAILSLIEGMDGNQVPLDAENLTYYNSLQVMYSHRKIYCESDNFSLAKQICDEKPEICDPNRPRWTKL